MPIRNHRLQPRHQELGDHPRQDERGEREGSDLDTTQNAALAVGDERRCQSDHSGVHQTHGQNTGREEIHEGDVLRGHRAFLDRQWRRTSRHIDHRLAHAANRKL
jgi:hypothetical protein